MARPGSHPLSPLLPLLLLSTRASAGSGALLDLDSSHTVGYGERWRCSHDAIASALSDALQTNYTGLGWSPAFVEPVTGNLTGCRELIVDGMHDAASATALGIALQASCSTAAGPVLSMVDLEGSRLEDAGATALAAGLGACGSLHSLHAPSNRIGDLGARALAEALWGPPPHQGLRLLDLHDNDIGDFGAEGLARLLRLPSAPHAAVPLRELRLHDNRLGAGSFAALADALRDNVLLESLMLSGNPLAADDGVAALTHALDANSRIPGRYSSLRRLYLARTNLTDVGGAHLRHLLSTPNAPPLEVLELGGNPLLSASLRTELEDTLAQSALAAAAAAAATERTVGVFRTTPV
jgi:hypothetical protein